MTTNKKIAAAISGVIQYLKEEREETISAVSTASAEKTTSAWRLYGRQNQMQMRAMMQMKAFHR